MFDNEASKNQTEFLRARAALNTIWVAIHSGQLPRAEGAELLGVLHTTLAETDGWSFAAMVAATRQAEALCPAH